jgi:hypothetical protein
MYTFNDRIHHLASDSETDFLLLKQLDKPTQPKECGKAYRMLDALSYSSARSALYAMSSFISNFELDIELQGGLCLCD